MTNDEVVIVYADGPNEVIIPITVFQNMEKADSILTKILQINSVGDQKKRSWNLDVLAEKLRNKEISLPENVITYIEDEYCCETMEEVNKIIERCDIVELYLSSNIFDHAYFGCGGPSNIIAETISFGELELFTYDLD